MCNSTLGKWSKTVKASTELITRYKVRILLLYKSVNYPPLCDAKGRESDSSYNCYSGKCGAAVPMAPPNSLENSQEKAESFSLSLYFHLSDQFPILHKSF